MRRTALALAAVVTVSGCSSLVDVGNPDTSIVDQGTVNSLQGALGLYDGAIGRMQSMYAQYILTTGLITDELYHSVPSSTTAEDARMGLDTSGTLAATFQYVSGVRGQAQQAIGALANYPHTSKALTAEMYALQGVAEVFLTETFCSGVPLDDAPFGKDFTYSAAISRDDVLNRAIAHFDTAATLGADSASVLTLAKVGKGRALLDLGDYAGAAAAVSGVTTDAQYLVVYQANTSVTNTVSVYTNALSIGVLDNEGHNGLLWRTTPQDPRVPLTSVNGVWIQGKYGDGTPVVLASGVEARLIEAEAQLHDKDYSAWIATLQALAATVPGTPVPADPGAVAGNDSARVSLQFHERAFWLFLTGHRQGDLRRLIRQYGRPQAAVFPTGAYVPANTNFPVYGPDTNAGVPTAERARNPLYTGCIDRSA